MSNFSIIRVAEYEYILNQFITPLKQTYEYESEYAAFGFGFGCIWIGAIAIILVACGIACMFDVYEEIGIELLAYAANIVLALIFRNKVSVTILPVIAFLFLVFSLIPESLLEKIGTKIDCIIEKRRNKSKKKDVENEIGEANAKLYQETLKKADELILINKKFGIEENVWEAIKNFLEQNPKSLTCIKNVFDLIVTFFVLEVYHNCPKNSDGHLNLDNDRRAKIKEILMQLNQKALKAFENAKELYYLDLDSSIKIAESNLKGSSMF